MLAYSCCILIRRPGCPLWVASSLRGYCGLKKRPALIRPVHCMPVNRKVFTQHLTRTRAPNWRCPRCDGGHLRILPGSFHAENTGETASGIAEAWFDWDMVETRCAALLRCDNADCGETASMAGRGRLVEDPDHENQNMEYAEVFEATYVLPSPRLIRIPEDCPERVRSELDRASVSQWDDADAAATHIRGAVERLLDDLNIPAVPQRKGSRKRLTLHDRIELLKSRRPVQAESLLATKWIGNAGAHGDEITRADVFDMFDILEAVLDQIYGHAETLSQLVREVNARKGPTREH